MSERKEYILKNVGKLYMRYGVKSITMDNVAKELGISKKTVYEYFTDKKELVEQSIDYIMDNPIMDFECMKGNNAIEKFFSYRDHASKMIKLFNNNLDFDLKKLYPEFYQKLIQFKKDSIYSLNYRLLSEGIEEGFFRKDLDVDFISRIVVGRILLIMDPYNEIFKEDEIRSEQFLNSVLDYHLHGICTEKGLKYYKNKLNNVENEN